MTKVDIYKSTGLANRLGVTTFPALVATRDGKISKIIKEIDNEQDVEAAFI